MAQQVPLGPREAPGRPDHLSIFRVPGATLQPMASATLCSLTAPPISVFRQATSVILQHLEHPGPCWLRKAVPAPPVRQAVPELPGKRVLQGKPARLAQPGPPGKRVLPALPEPPGKQGKQGKPARLAQPGPPGKPVQLVQPVRRERLARCPPHSLTFWLSSPIQERRPFSFRRH